MDPAALASLTIYNLPPSPPNFDSLGIFYLTFCATWTALVIAGMVFCWVNRRSPILRLRGLPLSFAAIICLHLYWILAQITYPIGGTMPVVLAYDVQYVVMGTWFPLGIALFHASNSRFLHVAKLQKLHFTGTGEGSRRGRAGCDGSRTSWLCRLRNASYTKRIMVPIGICMIVQVLLTIAMWVSCKKYHPTFGIPGTEIRGSNIMEQMEDLGRGWEWWPTVLWQFVWAWIVAPTMLWKAWSIRDTMGWRTQTVGCCLASLHATPMFLAASYAPAFAKINPYFPPSQWLHLSSMAFEIFAIFVPAIQVIRLRMLSKHTVESNAKWDTSSQASTVRPTSTAFSNYGKCKRVTSASLLEKGFPSAYKLDSSELGPEPDCRLLTMSALDYALRENRGSLQEFSALSDFSGENIAFITRVVAWKSSAWPARPASPESLSVNNETMLNAYNRALDIYADFISLTLAEFPLNLPSTELKHLEAMFEKSARILFGDETSINPITPFDHTHQVRDGSRTDSEPDIRRQVRYTGEIPAGFDATAFDSAQKHIKYLVLTNTWPKFVKEMHQRRRSSETDRSVVTANSETSILSKVSSTFSGFIRSIF
ncbi:integral membrane protein [Colletotrichum karsti]|uniref:Integral membrane protein n=1 Tax=Colletotrichum karsti TaxID=1095194 RepID=A0A9P6LIK4_9PEZI|nr:uncharacterized protein CkaCkLH20_08544 [Colletotrichum karsti]KAF9873810.1 integral membrane protein [Colletotrichum karsti]